MANNLLDFSDSNDFRSERPPKPFLIRNQNLLYLVGLKPICLSPTIAKTDLREPVLTLSSYPKQESLSAKQKYECPPALRLHMQTESFSWPSDLLRGKDQKSRQLRWKQYLMIFMSLVKLLYVLRLRRMSHTSDYSCKVASLKEALRPNTPAWALLGCVTCIRATASAMSRTSTYGSSGLVDSKALIVCKSA